MSPRPERAPRDTTWETARAGERSDRPAARVSASLRDVATETHDPYETAVAAAERLAELTGTARHDVALVLGSGWGPAAEQLGATVTELRMSELPGFAPPSAVGHAGLIRSVRVGDRGRALVFLGRTHLYEGHGVASVVHGVRTATAAGCRTVVLTNGCGGVRADLTPGQPVLISDHVNLTATSPLVGSRFVDLTDLYATRLRERCREIDPSLAEGVYAQLPGPHYETPAEIRMLQRFGADLVGMSTVPEVIAARAMGVRVLGISLVTNYCAGLAPEPLDHDEVLAVGAAAVPRLRTLLAGTLREIQRLPDVELA